MAAGKRLGSMSLLFAAISPVIDDVCFNVGLTFMLRVYPLRFFLFFVWFCLGTLFRYVWHGIIPGP